MYNYHIFIIVYATWAVVGAALTLAQVLRRAFRDPLPPPAVETAQSASEAAPRPLLSYAAPPVRISAFRKRPWLAGIGATAEVLTCLCLPVGTAIMAWIITGMYRMYAIAGIVVGAMAVTATFVVIRRGLKRTNGVPAAANWPLRKLWTVSILGLLACALTVFLLDMGTRHRIQQMRAEMDVQSLRIYRPVPAGTANAADKYHEAFALIANGNPKIADWPTMLSPAMAPPAFDANMEKAVSLLHDATHLPITDWGIAPTSYTITVLLPHLRQLRESANLLNAHACQAAMSGHTDTAMRDIQAIRAMARNSVQPQMLVEGLVALGIDALSSTTTENVLPFVRDEKTLDDLSITPDGWSRELNVAMLRGEQAQSLRIMSDLYDGKFPAGPGTPTGPTPLILVRVFAAEVDLTALRSGLDDIIAIASSTRGDTLSDIDRFDRQMSTRRQNAGLLSSILMPSLSRSAKVPVELTTRSTLTNLGIAARRYYLRTGKLPETLDELVSAGLIKEVPIDVFSGKPILMKAHQSEVVIYSVGSDGRDDGGDYTTGKDITFRVGIKPLWEIDRDNMPADTNSHEKE